MPLMWRVLVARRAVKKAESLGVLDRFMSFVRDLQSRLNDDPEGTIKALRGEPVIRAAGYSGRRIRMGDYRIFYYIDYEKREVRIFWIEHRRKAYKKR
ncbi:MAG: hypothetical protein DRJ37_00735 [Thermoprotei archaeon]|nr:MAG: hypothetical protein DRJ37_00735 [Thermoprotei archaeon]